MTKSQLPNHLHPGAREFYETLDQEFVFDGHERALLREAATALSISLEAADVIATEGMSVKATRGGLKTSPYVQIQRNASVTFASLLKALGLTADGRKNVAIPGARSRLGGRVQ